MLRLNNGHAEMNNTLALENAWTNGAQPGERSPMWAKNEDGVCVLSGKVYGTGGEDSRQIAIVPMDCRPIAILSFSLNARLGPANPEPNVAVVEVISVPDR